MFSFGGFSMNDLTSAACKDCLDKGVEEGIKCKSCGSFAETRKAFYIERVIDYVSQYRSSSMRGDRDIAWLALQKANVAMERLNKLESNFQINTLFRERIQED